MSRLKKGETGPGIRAKSDRLTDAVLSRVLYLRQALKDNKIPDDFSAHLRWKDMAKWENPNLGILKVSEGKLRSDPVVFAQLNLLRKAAAAQLKTRLSGETKAAAKKEGGRRALQRKLSESSALIQKLTDQLMSLEVAYNNLVTIVEGNNQLTVVVQKAVAEHRRRHPLSLLKKRDGENS